ncbi:MAG TPA: Rrf2 family transcriptional regulator [Labilithrix sp.]|jgi:Rrf2 family protein|nr:Rrf2 family transcriptional regulator [Labilithrix sp.]
MKRDSRLSVTLHLLLHMAETSALTSEALARQTSSHPVVIRRTMAGLRKAGLVRSEKGHGGGWTLARPLDRLTLGDVYDALGMPTVFAMGDRTESPGCLVEQAVNRAMRDAFGAAEALLMKRLHHVSLADLAADVRRHMPENKMHHHPKERSTTCRST